MHPKITGMYHILIHTINDILLILFDIVYIQWQMLHFYFHAEALLALKELGFKWNAFDSSVAEQKVRNFTELNGGWHLPWTFGKL